MYLFNGVRRCLLFMTFVVTLTMFLSTAHAKTGAVFSCVPDVALTKNIAPEAELTNFTCVMKAWAGSDTLHFNVSVKNISTSDQRFKVNIFLDNGKAVGGLLPRKTKNGLVKPGSTVSFVYPVKNMAEPPVGITLIIKTIGN